MQTLTITTDAKKQVVDITEQINTILRAQSQNEGVCNLALIHTTAALTTADLDPGTDLDLLDAFEAMIPKLNYRHPHDPSHVSDHINSALIGTSLTLPFRHKELILGTWQRVVIVEFCGPRERQLICTLLAE